MPRTGEAMSGASDEQILDVPTNLIAELSHRLGLAEGQRLDIKIVPVERGASANQPSGDYDHLCLHRDTPDAGFTGKVGDAVQPAIDAYEYATDAMTDQFVTGDSVIYRPFPGAVPEDGVVVRTNDTFVFVLYRGDLAPKATRPEDLERP